MISYFDSSAIVKWFFDEPGSDLARSVKERATVSFSSIIALPEIISAFNRAFLENRCKRSELEQIQSELTRIWPYFQKIKISDSLLFHAGWLVMRHNLRGFDSVHLASALLVKNNHDKDIFFSCFDNRLNQAANREDFITHYEK